MSLTYTPNDVTDTLRDAQRLFKIVWETSNVSMLNMRKTIVDTDEWGRLALFMFSDRVNACLAAQKKGGI